MRKIILYLITLLLVTNSIKANDSTLLYEKRINKLKEFYEWLQLRPYKKINIYKGDTSSSAWQTYDTALSKFFNRPFLDSLFLIRKGDDDIFSISDKFKILKQSISSFHELSQRQCFDSLKFKATNRDEIVQFFIIENIECHVLEFVFLDKTSDLISMPPLMIIEPEYKVFKEFYDKLKPCTN